MPGQQKSARPLSEVDSGATDIIIGGATVNVAKRSSCSTRYTLAWPELCHTTNVQRSITRYFVHTLNFSHPYLCE